MRSRLLALCVLSVLGCGDDLTATDAMVNPDAIANPDAALPDAVIPDAAPPDANPLMPVSLRQTGLYADFDSGAITPGVLEYVPQSELWSDGATKRRWIKLPVGSQIDTTDMDHWVYPEGTKVWKEFIRGGLRVETRLLWKVGPTSLDWLYFTFAWNAAQDDATVVIDGQADALGTGHNIPATTFCERCHATTPDVVLGFSAVQLDHAGALYGMDELVAGNVLTAPPAGASPYFPIPGNGAEAAALSYLHGNCSGCHNEHSPVMDVVDVDFRLKVASMATIGETNTYVTAVGQVQMQDVGGGTTAIVEPGDAAASALPFRMSSTNMGTRMPPVGVSVVDSDGVLLMQTWIDQIP